MKHIPSNKIPRILKAKGLLEKELKIKISHVNKDIFIEGTPEDEYFAEKVIDAINLGFPIQVALSIAKEDTLFEVLNIKNYTKRKDLQTIRARLIGREGGALRALTELTKCHIEVKGNEVGIIGESEFMPLARNAVISLIQGSKHANVYASLEHNQPEPILDLGLKEPKKKRTIKKKVEKKEKEEA